MADRTSRTPQRARAREDWAPRFLEALERSGMVNEAARAAGVGRQTVYDRRGRDEDFAAGWDEALETAIEGLEQEAVRRAMDGSDQLLMFLLRARRPAVYSERYRIEHAGRIEQPPVMLDITDPEVRKASRNLLHAVAEVRQRRLAAESEQ